MAHVAYYVENTLVQFQCNQGVWYEPVSGSPFSFEYTETLDTGDIVIDHVPASKRLTSLAPYQYVLISQKYTNNLSNSWLMLVNTFTEKMLNVADNTYQYTISLMSETKLLEKWQLPNKSFTHTIGAEPPTIWSCIQQLCALYIPKAKTIVSGGWAYRPIISVSDMSEKFSVPAKDIMLSQPTFRQALTALMSQIGCIPRVINRTLTYIDLREKPSEWSDTVGVNYIERSMASDSYVNTLVNMGDNMLDSNNYVLHERIGFRDKDNVLLKQKENLVLNTRLPIYNVSKLKLRCILQALFLFNQIIPDMITSESGDIYHGQKDNTITLFFILPVGISINSIIVNMLTSNGTGYTINSSITLEDIPTSTGVTFTRTFTLSGDNFSMSFNAYNGTITQKGFYAGWSSMITRSRCRD
jgi:hypothetical protein